MNTVHAFRKSGFKVFVHHQRWFNEYNEMMPRGGFTIIIVSKDGIDTEATAKCNPKENYRKKLGVQICLGRINEQLNGTR